MGQRARRGLFAGAALALALALSALPASAAAGTASSDYLTSNASPLGGTTLTLQHRGPAEIMERVVLRGSVAIPGPNQWVSVSVSREGKTIRERVLRADPESGRFRMRMRLKGCCEYLARAWQAGEAPASLPFALSGPAELSGGPRTLLFNKLLRREGYVIGDVGSEFDERTALGIMALRKTHGFDWTEAYAPELFELLLSGEGGFEPAHDEPGRHVEVDISRQLMALVEDGEPAGVFHVSTGSGGTPRGQWSFYSKVPGYNAIGMYYSAFYDGNYATHGYESVPTYPASHGCTRNPPIYSVFIYDWIDLGDTIYVYD
ncbi:MAG: L,D-transpeptidase [Actinobacteria bacterium]|nr:L,D-transpeptidase [Actinomycetota bacterium]